MEYRYQPYSYMQQMDVTRMPFYMSYPMQNLYLTEMEYEKDMERMKELYPREVKRVLEYVEEECDKMEYEGSLMFDEYPDRFMLEQIVERIYQKMRNAENQIPPRVEPRLEMQSEPPLQAEQYRDGLPPYRPPQGPAPGRPPQWGPRDDLRNLIGVLLNQEMYRRRCRHRRCNRWW